MDNLFEQMANISKAHGYDILAQQVKELKTVINELIQEGGLEDVAFTDDSQTKRFQSIVKKAKILAL